MDKLAELREIERQIMTLTRRKYELLELDGGPRKSPRKMISAKEGKALLGEIRRQSR